MSQKKLFFFTIFCFAYLFTQAQYKGHNIAGIVGFYNVENLFDTEDDPKINDEEYLPNGKNEWSDERYQSKLNNIARVIKDMRPDILGLSEIENRRVLEDLVQVNSIKNMGYQIIHFDSPDLRGVDVGIIYKPSIYKPFSAKAFPFIDKTNPDFKTRDILLSSGVLSNKDTVHFIVNHWTSRRGGGGEDKRLISAQIVRNISDSLILRNPSAKIIITGDFNDDPRDKSVKKILNATDNLKEDQQLYNTSYPTFKRGYGSLYYNGAYNLFDQIIISQQLLTDNSSTLYYIPESFTIAAHPYMQVVEGKDLGAPFRTFSYGKYLNGYSDHFPVFIVLGSK
ncbi:MAG: putative extracellular nuclease [Cyclobacteriaceae bacterium]|jgi:predicted extracellular nuclease